MNIAAHPPKLGRYRITSELGSGAMGSVYLARDERLGRDIAIKAMRPFPGHATSLVDRFFNEAKAIAGLTHPNIIRIFDVDDDDGVPFMVMEVAPGGSLKQRLERGPMPVEEVRSLGIQLALALAAAHERGILHRDVKPANVLRCEAGVWKLADFGVAHVPDSRLTLTGQFLGSPAYAPPEALEGGEFGPASDVYGLAATLYEAVTGRCPHADRGHETRIVEGDLETSAHAAAIDPSVPAAIRAGIVRGLARRPSHRPSAAELAATFAASDAPHAAVTPIAEASVLPPVRASAALRPAVETSPASLRRHVPLAVAAGVVCLAAYLIVADSRSGGAASSAARSTAPFHNETKTSPMPAAQTPVEWSSTSPSSATRNNDDYARRWERIASRVNAQDWRAADKELGQLLAAYPRDREATSLRAKVRRAIASRRYDRDEDRRSDEGDDHDEDEEEDD